MFENYQIMEPTNALSSPEREPCSSRKSTHIMAKEAAAIARYRGTATTSLDEPSKTDPLR